jgi:hypothetical protein
VASIELVPICAHSSARSYAFRCGPDSRSRRLAVNRREPRQPPATLAEIPFASRLPTERRIFSVVAAVTLVRQEADQDLLSPFSGAL